MTRASRIEARKLLDLLCAMWPEVFVRQGPRIPLAHMIWREIKEALPEVDDKTLADALAAYTSDKAYLRAMTAGTPRIRLDGRWDAPVDARAAGKAARQLAGIEARDRTRLEIADLRGAITRAGQALRRGDHATAARELRPYEPKTEATP